MENFWDLYGTLKVTVTGHCENRKEDISMIFESKIFPQVCSSDALRRKGSSRYHFTNWDQCFLALFLGKWILFLNCCCSCHTWPTGPICAFYIYFYKVVDESTCQSSQICFSPCHEQHLCARHWTSTTGRTSQDEQGIIFALQRLAL